LSNLDYIFSQGVCFNVTKTCACSSPCGNW